LAQGRGVVSIPVPPSGGLLAHASGSGIHELRPAFVLAFRPVPGIDMINALRRVLKFAGRYCGLRCVAISEVAGLRMEVPVRRDLFTVEPTTSASSLLGVAVQVERPCRHCGSTITVVVEGKGPHIGGLECADCGHFRQWLSRECCVFLAEVVARHGRPTEPIRIFEQVNRTT
jgi:hypothetical protein